MRLQKCFVALVVPCMAGVVIGGLMLSSSVNVNGDMSGRLETMNPSADFQSITGGCTVITSEYILQSYYRSSASCTSQCSVARACADRYIHTISVNADGTTHRLSLAPEDTLLSVSQTCGDLNLPSGRSPVVSSFSQGAVVPCWRSIGTITRNENSVDDPRIASHTGLEKCRYGCQTKIGYACDSLSNSSACITIVDPVEQVAYYASMPSTGAQFTRNLAITAGSLAGLVLFCGLSELAQRCDGDDDSSSEDAKA